MFVSEELGLGRGGQGADVGLGDTGEMVRQVVGNKEAPPVARQGACPWTRSAGASSDLCHEPKLSPGRARVCGSSEPTFRMSCLNNKLSGYTITVGALGESKSLFSDSLCFHGRPP